MTKSSTQEPLAELLQRQMVAAIPVIKAAEKMAAQYLVCFDLGPIDHEEWRKYHHLADEMKVALDGWHAWLAGE